MDCFVIEALIVLLMTISATTIKSEMMIEESGVQPSLGEDDMKCYLQQVLQEIKLARNHDIKMESSNKWQKSNQ